MCVIWMLPGACQLTLGQADQVASWCMCAGARLPSLFLSGHLLCVWKAVEFVCSCILILRLFSSSHAWPREPPALLTLLVLIVLAWLTVCFWLHSLISIPLEANTPAIAAFRHARTDMHSFPPTVRAFMRSGKKKVNFDLQMKQHHQQHSKLSGIDLHPLFLVWCRAEFLIIAWMNGKVVLFVLHVLWSFFSAKWRQLQSAMILGQQHFKFCNLSSIIRWLKRFLFQQSE